MLLNTLARRFFQSTAALAIGCVAAHAEPLIHDNGTFVTGVGTGTGGTDVSVAEPAPGVIGTTFNANLAPPQGPARVMDDFTIANAPGGGLRIRHMHFYGYMQQSSTPPQTTNVNFTGAYVQIYNGNPAAGGTLIAGDLTTNRLLPGGSTWTGAYRLSSGGSFANTRPITRLDIDMSWVPALADGNYWIDVTAKGDPTVSGSGNVFAFFVTPHPPTSNAYTFFNGNFISTWDYPFQLFGYCPADFNFSGGVTIDDLFLYFDAWFSNVPGADMNGQDGVTIDDLFLYINAWFGTC